MPHTRKVIFEGPCLNTSVTRSAVAKIPQSTIFGCCCTDGMFTVIVGPFSISRAAIGFFTLDAIRPLNMLSYRLIEEGVEPVLEANTQ